MKHKQALFRKSKMTHIIRKAKKEEAKELAFLVNLAGKSDRCRGLNIYGWELDQKNNESLKGLSPLEVGAREIEMETGQYSHNNMRVIDVDGNIAAVGMCYEIKEYSQEDLDKTPKLFHIFKELTNKAVGSFYLDSLAANPDFIGKGFGRMMLEDSIDQARIKGYDAIYLIAFDENTTAVRIYEKNGFKPVFDLPTPDHPEMPYGGRTVLFKKEL